MNAVLLALFATIRALVRRRADLEVELLALRHQVLVLQRQHSRRRVMLRSSDRIIALGDRQLLRVVRCYADYHNRSRTHLSLGKDPPEPRSIQAPDLGAVVAIPEVSGLHHRYERRMAA